MEVKNINAINLFCGAGGLAKGFENAGFDIVYALDENRNIKPTFDKNHDCEADIGDIEKTDPPYLDIEKGELDAVIGGPPCPTFSLVGRSKINSIEGRHTTLSQRHDLYVDFLRFVAEYEPKVLVMENVKGLLSAENREGKNVANVIREEMGDLGYDVDIQCLDAADFGVPQHRKRVFFIGNRLGVSNPSIKDWKTHRPPNGPEEKKVKISNNPRNNAGNIGKFKKDRNENDLRPWVTVGDAILDLPPVSPKGEMPPQKVEVYKTPALTKYQKWVRDLSNGDWKNAELYNHECRGHNLRDLTLYKMLGEGVSWVLGDIPDDFNPYRADIFQDKLKKQNPKEPSSTIVAHLHKDGHMFIHPREARSITPREAARLQSFKDSFEFPVSRTQAYKQIGNAVPPLLSQAIATALKEKVLLERSK